MRAVVVAVAVLCALAAAHAVEDGPAAAPKLSEGVHPIAQDHPRPASTVALYRYWNKMRKDHVYLADWSVLGKGAHGYQFQGTEGYVFKTQEEGTVPLYRYFLRERDDHIYTTKKIHEDQTTLFEGVVCYVYPRDATKMGTVALHVYYSAVLRDHFLTTDFSRLQAGRDGWIYKGVVGRMFPEPTQLPHAEVGDGTQIAVRRYFNPSTGDHLLSSESPRNEQEWYGWVHQGVQFYCDKTAEPGTAPLRIFYNPTTRDHLASADPAFREEGNPSWKYEGVLCYVSVKQEPSTLPLYRYYNKVLKDHFYTLDYDKLKKEAYGWTYEGIECYVRSHPKEVTPTAPALFTTDSQKLEPVYQYWNSRYRDHYFTTDYKQIKAGGAFGWEYQKQPFYVFSARSEAKDTRPLYIWFNIHETDYVYTTDLKEMGENAQDRWGAYKGVLGYVNIRQADGTVPLYRYWNETLADHFISTAVLPATAGYELDGILAFVPANDAVGPIKDTAKFDSLDTQAHHNKHIVPMYSFFNKQAGDHWVSNLPAFDAKTEHIFGTQTTAPKEKPAPVENSIGNVKYFYQGVAFYCYAVQEEGTVPLYRFVNQAGKDTMYTTSSSEGSQVFAEQDVECYLHPRQEPNTVPLLRYYNPSLVDHVLTTRHLDAKEAPGYVLRDTVGYVMPSAIEPEAVLDPRAECGLTDAYMKKLLAAHKAEEDEEARETQETTEEEETADADNAEGPTATEQDEEQQQEQEQEQEQEAEQEQEQEAEQEEAAQATGDVLMQELENAAAEESYNEYEE